MKLPGVVTNVTAFGAFVDVGVHQDGLVHMSELADRFVKDPAEVVKVGQRVTVTVLDVDLARNRIALSMRSAPGGRTQPEAGAAPESGQDRKAPRQKPGGKNGERPGGKPGGKKDPQKRYEPFNNPFADLLKKRS